MAYTSIVPSVAPTGADTEPAEYPSWRALLWFGFYRVLVATGLIVVFFPSTTSLWRWSGGLSQTATLSIVYSILVLVGLFLSYVRWPKKASQIQIAVFVDIVVLALLIHVGGGVKSGLELLLATAVAAGSLLMEGRLSLLFASLATLAVIVEQLFSGIHLQAKAEAFTRVGLLGVTFFAVAILGHALYRRIQQAEQLAARRKVDIADLSKLNEFIIQSMDTGVLVLDQRQRVRLANSAARKLLGAPAGGTNPHLRELAPALADWLSGAGGRPDARSTIVQLHEREIKPTLQLLGDSAAAGMLVFLRDNRDLVREAQQIKLASLGRLTASIAHNIRNPLSSVGHAGQLLAESPALGDEEVKLLGIIRRNTNRIDETVESVLQLSRRNQAAPQPIDLGPWLQELCAELREIHGLTEESLRLRTAEKPLAVNADPRHLHQILSNLCDNAIKHGSREGVSALIDVHARNDGENGVALVDVVDNGPGIEPQVAAEIFAPFFTTSSSGTGLGLYIARELSETNGIDLEYIPRQHGGSCFRLAFSA